MIPGQDTVQATFERQVLFLFLMYHLLILVFVLLQGALVKTDEQEVINFLLTTEIIPLCLRIMESGSELSKTVSTFFLNYDFLLIISK